MDPNAARDRRGEPKERRDVEDVRPDDDAENLGSPLERVPEESGDTLGIYELDGDKMKVGCVNGTWKDKQWTGKPRPTEFKLPAADVVLELRRVRADR